MSKIKLYNLFLIVFIGLITLAGCSDGSVYEGELKNGEPHGQGTFTWADGDKYVGEFMDDLPRGQGTYTCANGEVLTGKWANGE